MLFIIVTLLQSWDLYILWQKYPGIGEDWSEVVCVKWTPHGTGDGHRVDAVTVLCANPGPAELFIYIIYISPFLFFVEKYIYLREIYMCLKCDYLTNSFSAGNVLDARFWRPNKFDPQTGRIKIFIMAVHHPSDIIGIQMKYKELIKTFIMISNWKKNLWSPGFR